ncbi:single-stranded DNA-binding protein [Candidatus Peregrinibacteria bacterium]|nr:single-stranded DNA-binding protein [Candidatus Peregrinibacteria bacterium]
MFSLNRVHLIGYQTQPILVRQTPSGTSVTDMNLVTPYRFKGENGQWIEGKNFHTVTVWSAMADVVRQFVRPGSQLFISGRLQTDTWEDTKSNEKRSKTKIVAMDLIMLDPKDGQRELKSGESTTSGLNQAFVIGNVTRDPEMRTTPSGQHVLTLGVATNDRWKERNTGESRERTEFHNVVVWGALAEQAQVTMKKGQRVYATGRVQTRSFETQAGVKRYTTEIIAESVVPLGVKDPSIQEFIQTDSVKHSEANSAGETSPPSDQDLVGVGAIPAIDYTSEIKVEDLPF